MHTFLEEILFTLKEKHQDLSKLTIILPSKRAGGFLQYFLRKHADKTTFAPAIISIEEFIETLSDLKIVDTTSLIFKSYEAYLATEAFVEKEAFETYTTWINTLLNDFNEVDRYLVPPEAFFNYLGSIKTLEKWNVQDEQTELVQNYLGFWNSLFEFYTNLKQQLLSEAIGYQGLVYRQAAKNIQHYVASHGDKPHVFIGFNALNTAEQHIIQELLETGNSEIYWDADATLLDDSKHSASLFLRDYKNNWKYFQEQPFQHIRNHYSGEKKCKLIEVQKQVGQAKYVGEILSQLSEEQLEKTAVVLADENLLNPLLQSLPANITNVNITMGVALVSFPATTFFDLLLAFHTRRTDTLYYKDVLGILNHPMGSTLVSNATDLVKKIHLDNATHFTLDYLLQASEEKNKNTLELVFGNWENQSNIAISNCLQLVTILKGSFQEQLISRIVLFELHKVFEQLKVLNTTYKHLETLKTVHGLFSELIVTTTLDFQGDAYQGLQIMGILETRVLDFETVIMTSVNEGILPAGKSNASFITYDLKKQFDLPLFTEKDAVYAYHFYRLLHRSNELYFLYNTHSEGINTGEKSRFLLQLEIEKQPNHTIEQLSVTPKIHLKNKGAKQIEKTELLMERLREIAAKGFSPSALTSYIRNPIDFYFQKILRLDEADEVEETVAANTLGTIVHDSLEVLYSPLKGTLLTEENLVALKKDINAIVTQEFTKSYKSGTFTKGKNLLIFEVAKRYISNFIDFERAELRAGNTIKILRIEDTLKLEVSIPEFDFPVYVGGKVDRVDQYNDTLRIIDYKSGYVKQGDLAISDWNVLTQEYAYSKAFQVLAYASMMQHELNAKKVQAGIISFKNLGSGFLPFAVKEHSKSRTKDTTITPAEIALFTEELKKLILEICDQNKPFIEKEIE
ncbi:PD-(D/E)XK nuclease family protein [Candidatus Ulvibacter alkanivorans]|uniref:PD-(D/E)XK nuclease family protein n=1 Tax=Candidatus Ulvibacter alkanivorans TaxID=2267620 RepID=UPI000DF40274|nr:PD-(D/E)XK nuclease family protein [Candidatus Ulvibacter alkanivorans]